MQNADVVVDEYTLVGCASLAHYADEGEIAGIESVDTFERGFCKQPDSLIDLPCVNVRISSLVVCDEAFSYSSALSAPICYQKSILSAGLPAVDLFDIYYRIDVIGTRLVVFQESWTCVRGDVDLRDCVKEICFLDPARGA